MPHYSNIVETCWKCGSGRAIRIQYIEINESIPTGQLYDCRSNKSELPLANIFIRLCVTNNETTNRPYGVLITIKRIRVAFCLASVDTSSIIHKMSLISLGRAKRATRILKRRL